VRHPSDEDAERLELLDDDELLLHVPHPGNRRRQSLRAAEVAEREPMTHPDDDHATGCDPEDEDVHRDGGGPGPPGERGIAPGADDGSEALGERQERDERHEDDRDDDGVRAHRAARLTDRDRPAREGHDGGSDGDRDERLERSTQRARHERAHDEEERHEDERDRLGVRACVGAQPDEVEERHRPRDGRDDAERRQEPPREARVSRQEKPAARTRASTGLEADPIRLVTELARGRQGQSYAVHGARA